MFRAGLLDHWASQREPAPLHHSRHGLLAPPAQGSVGVGTISSGGMAVPEAVWQLEPGSPSSGREPSGCHHRCWRRQASTAWHSTATGLPKWRAVSLRHRRSVAAAAARSPCAAMAASSARNRSTSCTIESWYPRHASSSATAQRRRLPSCFHFGPCASWHST